MALMSQALVVGASSEIGAAIAVALTDLGLSPVLMGRDEEKLRRTASACQPLVRQPGQKTRTCVLDVTDHAALMGTVAAIAKENPVSAAVWVAGLFDWAPAQEADPARWATLIDTNLTAAAVFTAAAAPALIEAAPSALVYIGSMAGHHRFANNAAYVASKHGLAGLAGGTFLDLRDHGVKVSLVSPGLVAAGGGPTSPAGASKPDRLLSAADVAHAVRFVVTFPGRGCPTSITIEPQETP